jgi:hypothetical protein
VIASFCFEGRELPGLIGSGWVSEDSYLGSMKQKNSSGRIGSGFDHRRPLMPRKRARKKKHSVKANLHVLELSRAGSSLDLAIYADQEKMFNE